MSPDRNWTPDRWPAWSLETRPQDLAGYVLPDVVGPLLPKTPGPSDESPLTRAREIYARIAQVGIGYAHEAAFTMDGQLLRSPSQVLTAPHHATCLDLALVYAGGLVKAGLECAIALVEPVQAGPAMHALVLVPMAEDGPWSPEGAWATMPLGLLTAVEPDATGDVLVIDPNGLARDLGTSPTAGLSASFNQALSQGAQYLSPDGGWRWRLGVPVTARAAARFTPVDAPEVEPLTEPYRPLDDAPTPLQALRPEYELVRFQTSHEFTGLRGWCQEIADGDRLGVAVVHAVGGAGKTRLALELANHFRAKGWYAGALPKGGGDLEWLAQVVSPLLVIIDYADGRVGVPGEPGDAHRLFTALRARRGVPAVVILTARSIEGQWWDDLVNVLDDQRIDYLRDVTKLEDQHPDGGDIYRHTVQKVAPGARVPALPPPPHGARWTTLDLVLQGWLAAKDPDAERPATKPDLYEQALKHELNYWSTVYLDVYPGPKPERRVLRRGGALTSLLAPDLDQLDDVLMTVPKLATSEISRGAVCQVLATCLDNSGGQGLALRPDPIGDHLVLSELGSRPDLVGAALDGAATETWQRVVVTLTRAGQEDAGTAARLISDLLRRNPDRWEDVLAVAAAMRGPALQALVQLAGTDDSPLPLDELSDALPFTSLVLADLAVVVDRTRLARARSRSDADTPVLAELLGQLSERQRLAGGRAGALASATEAVRLYQVLAEATPAAYTPDLATSLNNLANRQSETGDRAGALASATEAVRLYQVLAEATPAAYTPNLATSLNNLANIQSETGDRAGALASATEAVRLYQVLAEATPAAYTPDLATSLNNLANRQSETGDRAGALASATEAVRLYQVLAEATPAAYTPNLATSLNNLANRQSETGDRAGALASATEAVRLRRVLAEANPAAYTPNLAASLNNLAAFQSETGDRAGALASATEAVRLYQVLAEATPAAYTPDLATSLNNLANRQSETGDRAGALASATEAVRLRRVLAEANPAAYTPNLAASLNNLAAFQSETGDRAGALASATEAVRLYQVLAEATPAAYTPNLAASLNNLAAFQSETGDRAGALASATEAVHLYQVLAEANPAAYTPNLAASLNNLAAFQSETGDRAGALASATEAVRLYQVLAEANPAAYTPDLAMSLNNLAAFQSETGDRAGALASATEAVRLYQVLAEATPAAYTPNLAASLNNLAAFQSETGDRAGALASATEAVRLYQVLAEATPAAYTPDLAMSLNNLANRQSETGDRAGALASATEAVRLYQVLAEATPAAYTPDLATSLNNLANIQSETGDRAGALASATEAVRLYQVLAEANPAAYTPDLATSLNNLAAFQSETGDRAGALASATEAVRLRRVLAEANPAAYTPDLAMSLNNLANRQSETGDRAGALASATEAVRLYQVLAEANPAAYTPDLATSLNNLANRLTESGQADRVDAVWGEAIDHLPTPVARGELRTAWAERALGHDDAGRAQERLVIAVHEIDAEATDQVTSLVQRRARHAVRELARRLDDLPQGLPTWVTHEVPDEHIDMVNAAAQSAMNGTLPDVLESHAETLTSPDFATSLDVLALLYPDHPGPQLLRQVLTQLDSPEHLPALIAGLRAATRVQALLGAWMSAPTWEESLAFHTEHREELASYECQAMLQGIDDDTARQHHAILTLAEHLPLDTVYQLITSHSTAEHLALDHLERGDVDAVMAMTMASPALQRDDHTMGLISAVLMTADGQLDTALEIASELAEAVPPTQLRAYRVHLGGLSRSRKDLDGIETLIAALVPQENGDGTGQAD